MALDLNNPPHARERSYQTSMSSRLKMRPIISKSMMHIKMSFLELTLLEGKAK
jgi:hypothetical protein